LAGERERAVVVGLLFGDPGGLFAAVLVHHVADAEDGDAGGDDCSAHVSHNPTDITSVPATRPGHLMGNLWGFLPLVAINAVAVILCARSAHTRPRDTTRSHVLSWLIFARRDASRSRATFCAGVSFGGGAAPRSIVVAVVLECACGPVAVKRVASAGERGIVGYRGRHLGFDV